MQDKNCAPKSLGALSKNRGLLYSAPMGIWFAVFFIAPILIIVFISFMKRSLYKGFDWGLSLEAYKSLLNPAYARIFLRTLWISALSAGICIIIALPCGFAMARSRHQTVFLFLIIIPFWTNSLIRIFAWMSILSSNGTVHSFLTKLGMSDETSLLYNARAIILVSVYMYLPYAILPIFTAIDKFDFSLLEAACDLGAKMSEAVFKVMLPNIKSGIVTSIVFTFIPIFGAYTIPLLVGGKDSYMIGNVIVDQINKTRNWPFAAALSMLITAISMVAVLYVTFSQKAQKKGEKGAEKL